MDSITLCESAGSSIWRAPASWNASLSRTTEATATALRFVSNSDGATRGLGDLLRTVERLQLERCRDEDLLRQELLGEGGTFVVEKCEHRKEAVAVKRIKLGGQQSDSATFQRRLTSVMLEIQIMCHQPLRSHPNILSLLGYGWETQDRSILPYILVEYSHFGTLRKYVQETNGLSMLSKEILMADVASALHSLHNTGIVHGDVKLDNVLVFQSWDRPIGAVAKLSDFGHSIVLASTADGESYDRYPGTPVYNAPETYKQHEEPILKEDLQKCDNWALGLLVLEILLHGDLYSRKLPSSLQAKDGTPNFSGVYDLAIGSIGKTQNDIQRAIFRSLFSQLLQIEPQKRLSDLSKLVIFRKWNDMGRTSLSAKLAIHSGSTEWSYHIFRPEGHWIPWEHQVAIAKEFEGFHTRTGQDPSIEASTAVQLASCYFEGFGVPRNSDKALEYITSAIELESPIAPFLKIVKGKGAKCGSLGVEIRNYRQTIIDFLMIKGSTLENKTLELGHPERPLRFSSHSGLVKAVKNIISNIGKHGQLHPDFFYLPSICNYILTFRDLGLLQVLSRSTSDLDVLDSCDKDPFAIRVSKTGNVDMLSLVATTSMASSEDEYGCNILHWLFLFGQDASVAATEFATVAPELCSRFINKPSKTVFSVHPQWPLQLFGTPLSFAVAVGSEHAVRALLNVGADPNALAYLPGVYTDHRKNWTAMHIAVKYQDVSMLDILRQGKGDLSKPTLPPSPDFAFSNRKSSVFKRGCRISKPEAAEDGLSQSTTSTNCPLVKVFCKNRSVNKPKPAGATDSNPLESEPLACALSFSSPLERLALHGSKEIDAMTSIIHAIGPATELSKPTSDCSSPLELAISFNDSIGAAAILHVSPGLVLTRLPSKIPEDFGLFPIHVATEIASHRNSSDTLDMPELLHTFNPACLDQRDGNGLTCLHYAVRGVSSISAQWILEKRPKLLESEDLLGTTAIFHCTTSICLKFLLEKGANLHHQTPRKRTILHHMAANGSGHLLRDLCTKFSKMDAVDVDGHTVLHLAVMSGNREAVAVSLAQGANLDTHNKSGLTALHIAVRSGRHDLAELLLSYEADPWQESNEGQYPLHWTIEKEDIHTSKLLLKSTDGWKPDQGGNTPLHLAATQGNTKMMEFLVNCLTEGTRLDHLNASGASALHIAAFHGHIGSLNALIDAGADPLVTQRDGSNAMHVAIRGATQPAQRYTDRLEVYKRLVGPPYRSMLFRPDVTGSLPWDEAVRCLDLDAIYWILHSQSYSDGDTTACRDLKYLERLHLCLESQIFSLGAGKAQIKDASHRIFRQAAIYGDHRLLHMFLNSNFLTQDRMRIELNHHAGTYFNSRVQNLDQQESGLIYDGVIDTLNSRQLNFVRRSQYSGRRFIERPKLRFSQIRGREI